MPLNTPQKLQIIGLTGKSNIHYMIKIKHIFLILILLCTALASASAQLISLRFPAFAGKEWELYFLRGQDQDTVLSGIIPPDGRVLLDIPIAYRGYAGMARWMLRDGGGLDMVVNGENFSVECLSDQPNEENIIFTGTVENTFLNANYFEQERLRAKYDAVRLVESAFEPGHPLRAAARAEKDTLEKTWTEFRAQLAASPLYAARFREIVDLTRGIGNRLDMSEREMAFNLDSFLTRTMSWDALYSSNHWSGVIYIWTEMHARVIQNDSALLDGARRILARLPESGMYTSFCDQMARYFVKNGKDSLLAVLAPEIKSGGLLQRADGMLAQFGALQAGEFAPDLAFNIHIGNPADHNHKTLVLRAAELSPKYSLLVFYQSGCGPCENTMQQLIGNYPALQQKGVRVLSISADTDIQIFENTANGHPWPDKYCDEMGLSGPNFTRYGVVGTPTLFVLDARGRVLLRTAGLDAVMNWLNNLPEPGDRIQRP